MDVIRFVLLDGPQGSRSIYRWTLYLELLARGQKHALTATVRVRFRKGFKGGGSAIRGKGGLDFDLTRVGYRDNLLALSQKSLVGRQVGEFAKAHAREAFLTLVESLDAL